MGCHGGKETHPEELLLPYADADDAHEDHAKQQ